ncbi:hypothetical protein PIB30_078165 [Stylosanthes scabra]|uniref:Uncharacterized protein n=1 Tax=Stylosanthes scabra TaxID=79078 RepID=A0ABU6QR59_9FABA|nr:hypothetical protein [Stylosanthes scabra]
MPNLDSEILSQSFFSQDETPLKRINDTLKKRAEVINQDFSDNLVNHITEANRSKVFHKSRRVYVRNEDNQSIKSSSINLVPLECPSNNVPNIHADNIPVSLEEDHLNPSGPGALKEFMSNTALRTSSIATGTVKAQHASLLR